MKNLTTIVLCLVLLMLAACATPYVASLKVHASPDTSAMPTVCARYNGDIFVGWATGYADAEIFASDSQGTVYGPVSIGSGRAIVHVRSTDEKWEVELPSALPRACRGLFRDSEVSAWGLTFE